MNSANLNIANRNTLWASIVAEELYRSGVRTVCISPGSRSTPLVLAFAELRDRYADFQILVQQAYQQWIEKLDPKMSGFFSQIHGEKELDDRLKVCQSSHDVIELAQECGVKLSEDELQRAAMVAEAISGFSFEKLWFRGLGLIS